MLDTYDVAILDTLRVEGRITLTELASRIGLTKTPCAARLRRLESDGFVLGYKAIIDHEKLGEGHVTFVQITLSDTQRAALEAFDVAVAKVKEVEQCHRVVGAVDYLLKIRTSDMCAFTTIMADSISVLPHVGRAEPLVVTGKVQ